MCLETERFEIIVNNNLDVYADDDDIITEDGNGNNEKDFVHVEEKLVTNPWEDIHSGVHTILLKDVWSEDAHDVTDNLSILRWDSFVGLGTDQHFTNNQVSAQNIEVFYILGGYSLMVALMHKWKDNIAVQKGCLAILSIAGSNHKALRNDTIFAGSIDCIFRAMQNFPNDASVQVKGCSALVSLTKDEEYDGAHAIMKYINNGETGLQVVLNAMKGFPEEEALQQYASKILCNISYDIYTTPLNDAGAVVLLALAMEKYKSNPDLQYVTRTTIICLLDDSRNKKSLSVDDFGIESEKVDSIIHQILLKELWSNNAESVEQTVEKLSYSLIGYSDDGQRPFSDDDMLVDNIKRNNEIFYILGGYSMITALMNKWCWHSGILTNCCVILSGLIPSVTSSNHPDMAYHAVFAGSIHCILRSMKKFIDHVDLQEAGCNALDNLTKDTQSYGARALIYTTDDEEDEHGVQDILNAMKFYPLNVCLQSSACRILYNLTCHREEFIPTSLLVDTGTLGLLVAAMENHKTCAEIQKMTRKIMIKLLNNDK